MPGQNNQCLNQRCPKDALELNTQIFLWHVEWKENMWAQVSYGCQQGGLRGGPAECQSIDRDWLSCTVPLPLWFACLPDKCCSLVLLSIAHEWPFLFSRFLLLCCQVPVGISIIDLALFHFSRSAYNKLANAMECLISHHKLANAINRRRKTVMWHRFCNSLSVKNMSCSSLNIKMLSWTTSSS